MKKALSIDGADDGRHVAAEGQAGRFGCIRLLAPGPPRPRAEPDEREHGPAEDADEHSVSNLTPAPGALGLKRQRQRVTMRNSRSASEPRDAAAGRGGPVPTSEERMAYVITEPCIGTKDTACVDVCPVDCIHPRKDEPTSSRPRC